MLVMNKSIVGYLWDMCLCLSILYTSAMLIIRSFCYHTGAQDFLPDFESASSCVSIASLYPRYHPISSAMQKARKWIADARVRPFLAAVTLFAQIRIAH